MPKVVDVNGFGVVEFPDSMSDADIQGALQKKFGGGPKTPGAGGSYAQRQNITGVPGAALEFLEGAGAGVLDTAATLDKLNPFRAGYNYLARKLGLAEMRPVIPERLGEAPDTFAGKAGKFAEQTAEFVIPGGAVSKAAKGARVIPRIAAEAATAAGVAGVQTEGDPLAMGVAAGTVGAGGAVASKLGRRAAARAAQRAAAQAAEKAGATTGAEAEVLGREGAEYLVGRGVPVSAGIRSGSRVVHAIQEAADVTPGGAAIKAVADKATIRGVRRVAAEESARTGAPKLTTEAAGEAVRKVPLAKAERFGRKAQEAYAKFHAIEEAASSARPVPAQASRGLNDLSLSLSRKPFHALSEAEQLSLRQTATRMGIDAADTVQMQMPVPMARMKALFRPVWEKVQIWPAAQQSASGGYKALQNIMNAPEHIPASLAEEYLGVLKAMARSELPILRDKSQGMAAFAVKNFQGLIDETVARIGGGPALAALRTGRRATRVKHGALEIFNKLRDEPVQAFAQATMQGDRGIKLVRQLKKEAPSAIPKLARAWLDDLWRQMEEKAAGGAGWIESGRWLANRWRDLGPATRREIWGATQSADLHRFFMGVERLSESANPSKTQILHMILGGTGSVGAIAANPAAGGLATLGATALSALMHSPAGLRALNNLLRVPVNNRAAVAAAASKVISIAEGKRMPAAARAQAEEPALVAQQ